MLPMLWYIFSLILHSVYSFNDEFSIFSEKDKTLGFMKTGNITAIRERIFKNYTKAVYPPFSKNVNISVGIVPLYVQEISEAAGHSTVLCGIDLYWSDHRLIWNPDDFHGIDSILVAYQEIWIPEVRFTLSTIDKSDLKPESPVRLYADGLIHVVDYRQVSRVARFDTENFPFDLQTIWVGFAQTSANVKEVKTILIPQNYTEIRNHTVMPSEWILTDIGCFSMEFPSIGEIRPTSIYSAIYCKMVIQRDPSFVIVNFCIPSYIVTILAVLAIHSSESASGPRKTKYELGLVSLMSVSVLTLSLTDTLPHSGTVSRLHILYYGMLAAIFTACFMSWVMVVLERHLTNKKMAGYRKARLLRYADFASVCVHVLFMAQLGIYFLLGKN